MKSVLKTPYIKFPFLVFVGSVCALLVLPSARAQTMVDQKKVVGFMFGTAHPLNADKTPMKDTRGNPISVYAPLGTGFFIFYPDTRGGKDFGFGYLVTAKHVLRDFDGTFLKSVDIRLNLLMPNGNSSVDFIRDIPVTDAQGRLLWFHSDNDADDVVAFPLLPDVKKFDFKTIPLQMFVEETTLKSSDVQEGDNLYFIGLLTQFYGNSRNYPVVRTGTLALMTDEMIGTPTGLQKAFIAELQSWPGNSGAPVFLNLGGLRNGSLFVGTNLRFLGLLVGGFLNRIQAPVVGEDQQLIAGDAANIGISFIVPATRLKSVLDSSDAQRNRDIEIQRIQQSAVPLNPSTPNVH